MFDITMSQVLSFTVPAMSFGKSYVYGNKWKYAPLCGVVMQIGWMTYAWSLGWTVAPGMILLSHSLMLMEIRNSYKWLRKDK